MSRLLPWRPEPLPQPACTHDLPHPSQVDDVAPHVPHSELLLAAKAEGLLRLGKCVPGGACWHRALDCGWLPHHLPGPRLPIAAPLPAFCAGVRSRVGCPSCPSPPTTQPPTQPPTRRFSKSRDFCEQPAHQEEGAAHRESARRAPWRLWLLAQCSWHEGDAGGGLRQQLLDLAETLEREERAAGGAAGAAAAATAAGQAASAFFPAAPPSRQEARRSEELRQLVGLPACAEVHALLEGLQAADRLRLAGNEAVKAGAAAEAVKKYSEALAGEGWPGGWLVVPCVQGSWRARRLESVCGGAGGCGCRRRCCQLCCGWVAHGQQGCYRPCLHVLPCNWHWSNGADFDSTCLPIPAATGLSPAIAAVLLSNRAAAHQHLKQRAQVGARPAAPLVPCTPALPGSAERSPLPSPHSGCCMLPATVCLLFRP